jgi:hypothetical protein
MGGPQSRSGCKEKTIPASAGNRTPSNSVANPTQANLSQLDDDDDDDDDD